MTNRYLPDMLAINGLYWIIRDYYNEIGNQKFTNDFGILFEAYFEELLTYYIERDKFFRLSDKEKNKKSADFLVLFDNCNVIIELKSSLIGLSVKQQAPSIDAIDTYFERTVSKANKQLIESEKGLISTKPVMKFIVLYENTQNIGILHSAWDLPNHEKNFFILTINDFEQILNLDRLRAENILENLLKPVNEPYDYLRSELSQSIETYIQKSYSSQKINYFKTFQEKMRNNLKN